MNKELEKARKELKQLEVILAIHHLGGSEAIETVLQALKNSISKEVIIEKANKYKKLSDEFYIKFLEDNKTDIEVHDAGISCDAKVNVLNELLEGK